MSRPIYQDVPHRWITPEPEIIEEGTDEPNAYGPVVYKKDEVRVRDDGNVVSLWNGARLERTI